MPKELSRQAAYNQRQIEKKLVSKRVWIPEKDEEDLENYARKKRERFLRETGQL